eukprot:COSAG01_NODE_4734_length_4785_cov_8.029236_4_plen_106_part_00
MRWGSARSPSVGEMRRHPGHGWRPPHLELANCLLFWRRSVGCFSSSDLLRRPLPSERPPGSAARLLCDLGHASTSAASSSVSDEGGGIPRAEPVSTGSDAVVESP